MEELSVSLRQIPGMVQLDNYEEIKSFLEEQMAYYKSVSYSPEDIKKAKADRAALNKLKKAITDRRLEIKKLYMEPYTVVENQAKDLVALIDEPLDLIKDFISLEDEIARNRKREQIKIWFGQMKSPLGDLADSVFESPAFYDKSWENSSATAAKCQKEIKEKVDTAARIIETIRSAGGKHTAALINKYIETFSMEETYDYRAKLESTEKIYASAEAAPDEEDRVIGYKILKINGTRRQMTQIIDQLELMGVDFDEIEDGMPGELAELSAPDFETFVAFDIETSGTYGAAYGDSPAEITEIGAVKVVNGKITERKDWLCNPGRKIVPRIAKLAGITDEMVKNKPSVGETIREFAKFVDGFNLVGHNIKNSDLHYIIKAANREGVVVDSPFFDTYLYAKKFKEQNNWENVKLEYLSQKFEIEQNEAHRAWCDAEANVGVYFRLREL